MAVSTLWLTLAVLVGLGAVWAWNPTVGPGLQAAAVAAGICWAASMLALICGALLQNTPQAVLGILSGTLLRTGLPLLAAATFQSQKGPLAEAGVFGYIVIFFLITLVVETGLLVRLVVKRTETPPAATPANMASTAASADWKAS